MIPFYEVLFDRFHNLHQEIKTTLDSLPEDGLDWKPNEAMNSVNVLVTHLTGAERFLIGGIIMGESSNRDREAEFQAAGLKKADLLSRLDETDANIQGAFEKLRLSDLEALPVDAVDLLVLKQAGVVPQLTVSAKIILSGSLSKAVKVSGLGVTKGAGNFDRMLSLILLMIYSSTIA